MSSIQYLKYSGTIRVIFIVIGCFRHIYYQTKQNTHDKLLRILYDMLFAKLTFSIFILAISISFRYQSTNPQYLLIRLIHSTLSFKHAFISDPIRPNLSAEYRAFENMIRLIPLTEYDALTDPMIILKDVRQTSSLANVVPRPNHCHVTHEVFEHNGHTVNTYWVDDTIKNLQGHADTLIVFMHGGGYVLGDVHSKFITLRSSHFLSSLFRLLRC